MTDFWKDSPRLEARLERVAAAIDSAIDVPGFPLREAVAAAAEPNGKLLRPALLIIGSSFGRAADPARIESLAAAIELLHVATLVHDDIIDDADTRRGGPEPPCDHRRQEGGPRRGLAVLPLLPPVLGKRRAGEREGPGRLIAAVCSAEISQDMGKCSGIRPASAAICAR